MCWDGVCLGGLWWWSVNCCADGGEHKEEEGESKRRKRSQSADGKCHALPSMVLRVRDLCKIVWESHGAFSL